MALNVSSYNNLEQLALCREAVKVQLMLLMMALMLQRYAACTATEITVLLSCTT